MESLHRPNLSYRNFYPSPWIRLPKISVDTSKSLVSWCSNRWGWLNQYLCFCWRIHSHLTRILQYLVLFWDRFGSISCCWICWGYFGGISTAITSFICELSWKTGFTLQPWLWEVCLFRFISHFYRFLSLSMFPDMIRFLLLEFIIYLRILR